ncbi:hypothetical protein PsorP6_011803 [Peronosclerospora sorghi]|uniref:Uncharacterized protein n=1 Tax=Peronosclerospora sorghi TaxID=230839 RepID=A0ACC0WL73_9STRA|nr:hypothetical protein PsorP6_011803 [Peronosclerospora sorghi]
MVVAAWFLSNHANDDDICRLYIQGKLLIFKHHTVAHRAIAHHFNPFIHFGHRQLLNHRAHVVRGRHVEHFFNVRNAPNVAPFKFRAFRHDAKRVELDIVVRETDHD